MSSPSTGSHADNSTPTTTIEPKKVDDTTTMTRPTEAQEEDLSSSSSDGGSSVEEQITKEEAVLSEENKSPETDTGKAATKRAVPLSGRSRKATGEMDTLFNKIITLIDTAENPNNATLVSIRETVAKCRVTLAEFTSSRRKRRSPGAIRKASQRKNAKRESEPAAENAPVTTAVEVKQNAGTKTTQRGLTARSHNHTMPVVRMRGPPPMFYGGDFWQPPFAAMGGVPPELVSSAAVYFDSGPSPMYGPPPQMMLDWRFAQRQQGSRRARDRRDRLVQEKEQAIIRAELRAARTTKDYERAIERAKRHGMDYEVQSATLRLERMAD